MLFLKSPTIRPIINITGIVPFFVKRIWEPKMKHPSSPNPLALLLDPEKQRTRRRLIKEVAVFTGMVAVPLQSTMAATFINLDPPKPKPAKSRPTKKSARGNIISLNAQDSAICLYHLDGDINSDCRVDTEDLEIMQSDWLSSDASARGNIDSAYSYLSCCDSASSQYPCCDSASSQYPCCDSANTRVYVDFLDFQLMARNWLKCSLPECQ